MSLSDGARFGMSAMGAFSLPGPKRTAEDAPTENPIPLEVSVAGITAVLDPSAALYWPAEDTLVVADLHLETGSSYARTGQMLPPYDTEITLARLAEVLSRYTPRRLIALGDSFHDPFGAERLQDNACAFLVSMCAAMDVTWITGNHDKHCAEVLGGEALDELTVSGVTFRHIPVEGRPQSPEVAGHLHPAARIIIRGRTLKRRAFIGCADRLVMPAFGCLTGGLPVTDPAFAPLWPARTPTVHMIGANRVFQV